MLILLTAVRTAVLINAHKYSVISDYLDILPADFQILIPAQKPETFALAVNYYGLELARAGVNFNVSHIPQPASAFGVDNLFVAHIRYTAVHSSHLF